MFVLFLPLFRFSNFVVASSRVIAVFAPAELLFHVSHFPLVGARVGSFSSKAGTLTCIFSLLDAAADDDRQMKAIAVF